MAKVNSYISHELEFLDQKLKELKEYISSKPFHELEDRMIWKDTIKGPVGTLVASIEKQQDSLTKALKEYATILEMVDKLREKEESKQMAAKGDIDIPYRMRK